MVNCSACCNAVGSLLIKLVFNIQWELVDKNTKDRKCKIKLQNFSWQNWAHFAVLQGCGIIVILGFF